MSEPPEYGPRMAQLTELQRNYIKAMASAPFATSAEWARRAGYSDTGKGAKVAAFRLRHDPKIEAAVLEHASVLMHRDGPVLAVVTLMEIARDKDHPRRLQAAEAICDRIGLHRLSEHRLMVEHTGESAMQVENIHRMSGPQQLLNVDIEKLRHPLDLLHRRRLRARRWLRRLDCRSARKQHHRRMGTIVPSADSEEKHEPVSDIDTAAADSLKVLDPKRPIREADIG